MTRGWGSPFDVKLKNMDANTEFLTASSKMIPADSGRERRPQQSAYQKQISQGRRRHHLRRRVSQMGDGALKQRLKLRQVPRRRAL